VTHVCCSKHTAVITTGGELYACGPGVVGQLGHGNSADLRVLTMVEGLRGYFVSQVACRNEHTAILSSDGHLWTFGSNGHGQTGHSTTEGIQSTPRRVQGELPAKKEVFIAVGYDHTACITKDESTYSWGDGKHGRLGHGDETSHLSPKLLNSLSGKEAEKVACGWGHTIVRSVDGMLYSFGYGTCGQLGLGNTRNIDTPTPIDIPLEDEFIVQVACGVSHSMALTSNGRLFTWGCGEQTLGHGSEDDCNVTCIVKALNGYKVVKVSTFNDHSVALVESKQRAYAKRMKAMINDESCSDIIFLLKGGDHVHAIKGLLIGHSEYFRAMFRSNMRESKENRIEVPDCSKTVFLLFVEYLYTGTVNVGMDHALELYVLADRYQENGLSRQCGEVIKNGLSHENIIGLLVKVNGLGLDALTDICVSNTASHFGKVVNEEVIDSIPQSSMRRSLLTLLQREREKLKEEVQFFY